jgi:hypothetical protein
MESSTMRTFSFGSPSTDAATGVTIRLERLVLTTVPAVDVPPVEGFNNETVLAVGSVASEGRLPELESGFLDTPNELAVAAAAALISLKEELFRECGVAIWESGVRSFPGGSVEDDSNDSSSCSISSGAFSHSRGDLYSFSSVTFNSSMAAAGLALIIRGDEFPERSLRTSHALEFLRDRNMETTSSSLSVMMPVFLRAPRGKHASITVRGESVPISSSSLPMNPADRK